MERTSTRRAAGIMGKLHVALVVSVLMLGAIAVAGNADVLVSDLGTTKAAILLVCLLGQGIIMSRERPCRAAHRWLVARDSDSPRCSTV